MQNNTHQSELQISLLHALQILYDPSSAVFPSSSESYQQANEWLMKFQKSPEAWSIAFELLECMIKEENNLNKKSLAWLGDVMQRKDAQGILFQQALFYFGAQTLRMKVSFDWDQLFSSKRELSEALASLIINRPIPILLQQQQHIWRQLAISHVIIMMRGEDGEGQGIEGWWKRYEPILIRMVEEKDHEWIAIILRYLTLLAEEGYETRADLRLELKRIFVNGLRRMAVNVLRLLEGCWKCMEGFGDQKESIRKLVLNCMSSWIREGIVRLEMVQKTCLLDVIMEIVGTSEETNPASGEEAVYDVMAEMVDQMFNEREDEALQKEWLKYVYKYIPKYTEVLRLAMEEHDDEKIRKMTHMLVEIAECSISWIVLLMGSEWTDEIQPTIQNMNILLQALILLGQSDDLERVNTTLRFWYLLAEALNERDGKKLVFVPYYSALLALVLRNVRYPLDSESWKGGAIEEFRQFRHDVGDTLKDCCAVLGSYVCLSQIMLWMQEALQAMQKVTSDWQGVEACLFGLRSMGSCIDTKTEKDKDHVLHMLEIIVSLPFHPKIQYTGCLIIGRYSEFMKGDNRLLQKSLAYLLKGFEFKESLSSAALSLKFLCIYCAPDLSSSIASFVALYHDNYSRMRLADRLEILEGIANLMNQLTPMDAKIHYMSVYDNLIHSLQTSLSSNDISEILEQITILLKHTNPYQYPQQEQAHPATVQFMASWPIYRTLFSVATAQQENAMEKLCKLLRQAIQSFRRIILPLFPELIILISQSYAMHPYSCHLYLASECYYEFGLIPELFGYFRQSMVHFLQSTCQILLCSENSICQHPDIVEDFFQLAALIFDTCPHVLFPKAPFTETTTLVGEQDAVIQSLFSLALRCFVSNHKEPLNALLLFWTHFYHYLLLNMDDSASINSSILLVLSSEWTLQLLHHIFTAFLTYLPNIHLFRISEIIISLSKIHSTQFSSWWSSFLSQFSASLMTVSERQDLLHYFDKSRQIDTSEDIADMNAILKKMLSTRRARSADLSK